MVPRAASRIFLPGLLLLLAWSFGVVGLLEALAQSPGEKGSVAPGKSLKLRDGAYILEVRPVQTIHADYTIRYRQPDVEVEEWRIATAKPPVLIGQRGVSVSVAPTSKEVVERSPERRRVLIAVVPAAEGAARHWIDLRVHFQATLYSRKLLLRDPTDDKGGPPDLDRKARALYLRQTETFDYRSEPFRQWLDRAGMHRREGEGDIAFARRAFLKVWGDLDYTRGSRIEKSSLVVQKRQCVCGGFANVYVSTLRANGIPARTLSGSWIPGKMPFQTHAKTEFFVRNVGWIPVDPSSGMFGEDQGDFFIFHVDHGLEIPFNDLKSIDFPSLLPISVEFTGSGKVRDPWDDAEWKARMEPLPPHLSARDGDIPSQVPRAGRHAERQNPYRSLSESSEEVAESEGLAHFWDRAKGDYQAWSEKPRVEAAAAVASKKPR